MNQNSTYEVAVWRAKESPSNHKALIISQTNQALSQLKGFQKRSIFQAINDPLLMFDWVEWDTAENAINAAKAMMNIPELKDFVSLIEKTELFEHYTIHDYHEKQAGESEIIELVAYQLNPAGEINAFKDTYSQAILNAAGYQNRYLLANGKGENQWAEFVHWNSVEEAQKAAETMINNPEVAEVYKMVKEVQFVHQYFAKFA